MTVFENEFKTLYTYIMHINNHSTSIAKVLNKIIVAMSTNKSSIELSIIEHNSLIDYFIKQKKGFDDATPNLFTNNNECINAAIEFDINSINYIPYRKHPANSRLAKKIREVAKSKGYLLCPDSPSYLRKDYQIALNSIKTDIKATNYIDWDGIRANCSQEEVANLIKAVVDGGYVLSRNSDDFLKENRDIVWSSIKQSLYSANYSLYNIENDKEIFKYLLLNNYYKYSQIDSFRLHLLIDEEIFSFLIHKGHFRYNYCELYDVIKSQIKYDGAWQDQLNFAGDKTEEYIKRLGKLYYKALTTPPKIKDFEAPLNYFAERAWERHRNENRIYYNNIFGRICAVLDDKYSSFEDAFYSLEFIDIMEKNLGSHFATLKKAMTDYHSIKHGSSVLGETLESTRNQIAKLSAKYIAISKEIEKSNWLEANYDNIKDFYKLKIDAPIVRKKVIESRQKEAYRKLYNENLISQKAFQLHLVKKYGPKLKEDTNNEFNASFIKKMMDEFILHDHSKITNIVNEPKSWHDYKRKEEAKKLINRLNSHYISYSDLEVANYLDIIKYDKETDKYYYSGPKFSDADIKKIKAHEIISCIFEEVKKEIMSEIKKTKVNETIKSYDYELNRLDFSKLPFNDKYYEFNYDCLSRRTLRDLQIHGMPKKMINPFTILDDENYEFLTNHIINNSLLWLLIIEPMGFSRTVDIDNMCKSIKNSFRTIDEITRMANSLGYDLNKYNDIQTLSEICKFADKKEIAILGPKLIRNLYTSRTYTEYDTENIIRVATKLIAEMSKRSKSTVPYVNGTCGNYNYSIYDPQDEEILLAGIRTDACFKVDGVDNDFLHYCALDKNGFVLKITDSTGEFIARGSGFRNGNCVYINQLRTVYDEGGECYVGAYNKEIEEIINTFYKACQDIVDTSQNNPNETNKIDYVIVTASYSLTYVFSDIPETIKDTVFHSHPMDNKSEDWYEFVNNTANLSEISFSKNYFSTDFRGYDLICVGQKDGYVLSSLKLYEDNEPLYKRVRNKVVITDKIDRSILNKINKIEAIASYLEKVPFDDINLGENPTIFTGDNWYIVYDKSTNMIVSKNIIDYDVETIWEYNATLAILKENAKDANTETINNYKRILKQNATNKLKGGAKNE